jgi:hypothetical protein
LGFAVAKLNQEWTILPRGRVRTVDDRIVTVEGEIPMPLANFPRRMTVVGLSGNRSAIFSAIALDEAGMREVEAVGKPTFLIVPNGHHRLDAPAWKKRYPGLKVLCPAGAKDSVSEAVPVDATRDVLKDSDVDFITVGGTGQAEAALIVLRKGATTLIVNDIVANLRNPHGLGAKLMARLFDFGVKEPQVPRVVKRALVKDTVVLARQLRRWSKLPDIVRLIPSHGEIIEDPRPVLERLAADLS